jgi:hypothetical protein
MGNIGLMSNAYEEERTAIAVIAVHDTEPIRLNVPTFLRTTQYADKAFIQKA